MRCRKDDVRVTSQQRFLHLEIRGAHAENRPGRSGITERGKIRLAQWPFPYEDLLVHHPCGVAARTSLPARRAAQERNAELDPTSPWRELAETHEPVLWHSPERVRAGLRRREYGFAHAPILVSPAAIQRRCRTSPT